MGRLIPRLLFLLSLAFNAAFLVYLLTGTRPPATANMANLPRLTAESRQQMRLLRRELQPQYARLQNRLTEVQTQLLTALRADPVDTKEVDACLQNISAVQLEWQQVTVAEILQCKHFLSSRDCACLLERLGTGMGVPAAGCENKAHCPRDAARN
jgi:hypothetical protein